MACLFDEDGVAHWYRDGVGRWFEMIYGYIAYCKYIKKNAFLDGYVSTTEAKFHS